MVVYVVRRGIPVLLAFIAFLAFAPVEAHAQAGVVLGTVTDANTGQPLASVQVHFPGLSMGSLTNALGRFQMVNVPVGQHEIRAEIVGHVPAVQQVEVRSGESVVVDLALESRAISMQGMVVTGVASATPQAELPFTVDHIEADEVQRIPATTAASMIQGKVAGAKIVQGSGQPGEEPSIQLRGPTSITGSQEPLIIVDGVITRGKLADIDPLDIESIEVVKGAAAASLYGSRAQAGVIQITTRRGTALPEGETEVAVRNMFQVNGLERKLGVSNSHPYRMTPDGLGFMARDGSRIVLPARSGEFVLDDGGAGTNPYTTFQDNAYPPPLYDPFGTFFSPGNFASSYVSVGGNEGDTQYRASFRYTREEGAVQFHDGLKQRNFRLNVDHRLSDNWQLALSTYVADVETEIIEQGGSGLFRDMTFMSPKANLAALDAEGAIDIIGDPVGKNSNPLYTLANREWTRKSRRLMGSADLSYAPRSWLSLQGNVSYDRGDIFEDRFVPPGFKRIDRSPLQGSIDKREENHTEVNASLTAALTRNFGDLTTRTRLRWLVEGRDDAGFQAGGDNLLVGGVPRLSLITGTPNLDSFERTTRSQGVFLISALTYKSRYVLDLLARRDGSSLFGPDERWQNYYRVSTAWRMAQETWWPLDFISEFKPRFSIGTSGGRPSFEAQYQTYAVAPGQITARILGNNKLKPELATEQEFGFDAVIADRLRIQANYVDLKVEDQLLLVPLPSFMGFEAQWRNAGTLEAKTYELVLEAAVVERPNLLWTARLNLDRTRQKITELGVPPYKISDYRAGMWVREGEVLGAFYGLKWANDCGIDLPAEADCGQFDVNDDGLLVWVGSGNSWQDGMAKGLWGTSGETGGRSYDWGMPIRSDLDDQLTKLGESLPDVNLSLFQDVQWRSFGLSFLFDAEYGAQIYHQTRQWACRDARCPEADQAGKPDHAKKPISYYGAAGVYARNTNNSWFTEDADYLKLRELSLRYTINDTNLPSLVQGFGVDRATINLTGRNVKTWTGYPGYDPEVGKASFGGSAAIGRIDEYFYPNFRSFGLDVELVF